MDKTVGQEFRIWEHDLESGVRLTNGYWYPYFVLEKVEEIPSPNQSLTGELERAYRKLDNSVNLESEVYESIQILINVVKQLIPKEEK